MDERNLNFKIGDLVEWIELCGEGFLVKERGLGLVIQKNKQDYKVRRLAQQDIANFNVNQLKMVNEK